MATKINNQKVLVTGSSGFIGSHLMKALGDRGIEFDINKNSGFDVNDITNLKSLIVSNKPSVIVHLAAVSNIQDVEKDPEKALRTNLLGSFNVMRLAHEYGIKVILASSASVSEPKLSLYGTTKKCMEELSDMFNNIIIARFYNVYGEGSKSIVNKIVDAVKHSKGITLNGNTVRDYIHVDDVVEAIVTMIDLPKSEYNLLIPVGTGRGITLKKLVSLVEGIIGRETLVIEGNPIPEIQESICHELDYKFYKTTLEQGIRRLI
jgi:nucleoside-diphosphate-sugar epimerase